MKFFLQKKEKNLLKSFLYLRLKNFPVSFAKGQEKRSKNLKIYLFFLKMKLKMLLYLKKFMIKQE